MIRLKAQDRTRLQRFNSFPSNYEMSAEDAVRWNARYRQERYSTFEEPRSFLTEHAAYLPDHGLALDVAMGLGGNARFLLKHGLRVVGMDISRVALQHAKSNLPQLMAVLTDLPNFYLAPSKFDVILNFYFLERELWPKYKRALKPGGILFFETLTQEMQKIHPEIDPHYLLKPRELCRAFDDLEILVYREGWYESDHNHPRAVASLIARVPAW